MICKNYDEFKNHFAHHFHFKDGDLDGDKDNAVKYFYETYCKDGLMTTFCDPANEVSTYDKNGDNYLLEFFPTGDGDISKWMIMKATYLDDFNMYEFETIKEWIKITLVG